MITSLYFDNFRSLKDVFLPCPSLAFFCGPNGSGKTNVAEAIDFLSKAFNNGLPYAVAEKGGFFNMCFRKERRSRGAITFGITGSGSEVQRVKRERREVWVDYQIRFSLRTKGETIRSDYYVDSEQYLFNLQLPGGDAAHFSLTRKDGKYVADFSPNAPEWEYLRWLQRPEILNGFLRPDERTLLYPAKIAPLLPFRSVFESQSIRVYRLSPRYASAAGAPSVSGELGKYGQNLPSALDYLITNDPKASNKLKRWVRDVIPNLEYLKADYTQTRQMGLFVQEKGFGNQWYAEELSDGTLMSIALFLAVLDSRNSFVFIEEPENSLHPWILHSFLQCCRDESEHKQILISTQSPLVVARATPDNLFLVERVDGRSSVLKASERDPDLKSIIDNRFLDLGEYWVSGGLKAVPNPPSSQQDELFRERE